MGYKYKWKPSKSKAEEFAIQMEEIAEFCIDNGIIRSQSSDSYYFTIDGQEYRVSNHSIEASNSRAYDEFGTQIREKYHPDEREKDVIYIHASKTRIIEIYNNLKDGYKLDGRGYIVGRNEERDEVIKNSIKVNLYEREKVIDNVSEIELEEEYER